MSTVERIKTELIECKRHICTATQLEAKSLKNQKRTIKMEANVREQRKK
jgi:hypothetical protein